MAKLLQVFLNVDFRCAHEGLAKVAKDAGIDVKTLEPGNYLCFINTGRDRLKLYASHNVVAYLKLPAGKIDLRTLSLIPQAFKASGKIDYDAALKEVLINHLKAKRIS